MELKQYKPTITTILIFPIIIFVPLAFLAPKVLASDEVVKAEMYLGDYEISKEKVGTSFVNKEVKYIETGSGKIIKERTSSSNTWKMNYYHTNHQGSTSVVTNNQGQKDTEFSSGRLRYFPYGEQITKQDINNLVVDDTYTGQKRDTETDLMFYNARLYNQKTGLFMQADSVNDGLNRYAYVGGSPVNGIDPTGKVACELVGECGEISFPRYRRYNHNPKNYSNRPIHFSKIEDDNPEYKERYENLVNDIKGLQAESMDYLDIIKQVNQYIGDNYKYNEGLINGWNSIKIAEDEIQSLQNDKIKSSQNQFKLEIAESNIFAANIQVSNAWKMLDSESELIEQLDNNLAVCAQFALAEQYLLGKIGIESNYQEIQFNYEGGYFIHANLYLYSSEGILIVDPTWGLVMKSNDYFDYISSLYRVNRDSISVTTIKTGL